MAKCALWLVAVGLAGCAGLVCRPATVIVTKKQEMARLDTGPSPMRTTETGRLEEAVRPTVARDYWVQSREGRWYRVSAEQFGVAQVGHALQVCE